ncbi:MAG: class E sortase [Angustibacter sp.]
MRVFRATLGVVGELMITAGLVLLLFVGWQLWWTTVTANRKQSVIADGLTDKWRAEEPKSPNVKVTPKPLKQIPLGEAFALIRIPKLGRDYVRPIVQGTLVEDLKLGVGHYTKSVGPGEVGNFAIAGHRTTYGAPFSEIPALRSGDPIVIETSNKWFIYTMEEYQIVSPDDYAVVAPVPNQPGAQPTEKLITLTTCHPQYSAKQRYIVHGKLLEVQAKVSGKIPDVLS